MHFSTAASRPESTRKGGHKKSIGTVNSRSRIANGSRSTHWFDPSFWRCTMAQIEIENLCIRYKKPNSDETFMALSGITHSIEKGSFVTIVGSSGCGKSSLLMAIAGLTPYTSGSVRIDGKTVSGSGPDRAVIFQDASLLPWRSVLGNIPVSYTHLRAHET